MFFLPKISGYYPSHETVCPRLYLNGVLVQQALIIDISVLGMLLAQNKKPHLHKLPVLFGKVESGKYWRPKKHRHPEFKMLFDLKSAFSIL
jgi:hypothetical protein